MDLPRELLDGSDEAARMAERLLRRFVVDVEPDASHALVDRLAWAIAALERADPPAGGLAGDG